MTPVRHQLGARIRHLRLRRGMTRPELAALVGASEQSMVYAWETGRRAVSVELLVRIAKALGVRPALLLWGIE